MSLVQDVLGDVQIARIPSRIADYETLIDAAESVFELKGRNLEDACKKHAQNLMFYDVMLQECKTIEDTIKVKVDELEGRIYKRYNEQHQIKLGTNDIRQYVRGDPEYVTAVQILIEVVHTKRRLEAIVEALKSMGWSLNNIVKLRIAQLEDVNL